MFPRRALLVLRKHRVPLKLAGGRLDCDSTNLRRMTSANEDSEDARLTPVAPWCVESSKLCYVQAWLALNPQWTLGSFLARALRSSLGPG